MDSQVYVRELWKREWCSSFFLNLTNIKRRQSYRLQRLFGCEELVEMDEIILVNALIMIGLLNTLEANSAWSGSGHAELT